MRGPKRGWNVIFPKRPQKDKKRGGRGVRVSPHHILASTKFTDSTDDNIYIYAIQL